MRCRSGRLRGEDAPFKIKTPAESPVRIEFYPFTVEESRGKWIYRTVERTRDPVARWKFSQRKPIQNQGLTPPLAGEFLPSDERVPCPVDVAFGTCGSTESGSRGE